MRIVSRFSALLLVVVVSVAAVGCSGSTTVAASETEQAPETIQGYLQDITCKPHSDGALDYCTIRFTDTRFFTSANVPRTQAQPGKRYTFTVKQAGNGSMHRLIIDTKITEPGPLKPPPFVKYGDAKK
jgi:hypothetical protein